MIIVLDLSKLYPSIIVTENLSYETYTDDTSKGVLMPSGYRFIQEPEGFLTRMTKHYFKMRDRYEDELKNAKTKEEREMCRRKIMSIKVLTNSLYGAVMRPYFRLYRHQIGETITRTGREILKICRDVVENQGFNVIGGDTDSVMVDTYTTDKYVAQNIGKTLEGMINERLNKYALEEIGIDSHIFRIEFESISSRFLQTDKKKRYACHVIYEDGEWLDERGLDYDKIVGFEYKRADNADVSKDMQSELFETILQKGSSKQDIINVVRSYYNDVKSGVLPIHYIAKSPKLKKHPKQYKQAHPHSNCAEWDKSEIDCEIRKGDRVFWVYLKDYRRPYVGFKSHTDVPEKYIEKTDYEKMAEKVVLDKAKRIFDALGYLQGSLTMKEIIEGGQDVLF